MAPGNLHKFHAPLPPSAAHELLLAPTPGSLLSITMITIDSKITNFPYTC